MGCSSSKEVAAPTRVSLPPPSPNVQPPAQGRDQGSYPVASSNQQQLPRKVPINDLLPANQLGSVPNSGPERPQAPSQQQQLFIESARSLDTQPPGWPKIMKLGDLPIIVFVVTHSRWSPNTDRCPCWTYISSGLHAVNQPEIVFTIRQRDNEDREDFLMVPLEWARILYLAAANDHKNLDAHCLCKIYYQDPIKVDIGGVVQETNLDLWTDFQNLGALVHLEHHGDYVDVPPLPYPRHHVMALTHREAAVAEQFGTHRVLSRLTFDTSWFPMPPWIDRDRPDIMSMADNAGSFYITVPVPSAKIYGLSALIVNETDLLLRVPDDPAKRSAFQEYVRRQHEQHHALRFQCYLPSDSECLTSWKTGNKAPQYMAKTQEFSRASLNFFVVAQGQDKDACKMVEDGYGLLLTDSTWMRMREAIVQGREWKIGLYDLTALKMKNFWLQWRRYGEEEPPVLRWRNMVEG